MLPPLLLLLLPSLLVPDAACGAVESTFIHCCSIGSALATEQLQCGQYTAPVIGVSVEQQSMCLSAIEICCLQTYRDLKCADGKRAAKQGAECVADTGFGGDYRKDCCEACKLGLITASMNMGCAFRKFSFSCPWDDVHRDCCLESAGMLESPEQNNTIPSGISTGDTGGVLGNLCDILRGELCAHICVSVPGSYKCECHEGFVLMSDGKSCQQKDFPDRCAVNNPCAHKCVDTGIAVECSCEPGYQLGVDERSCYDIDECILKMDLCDQKTQHCRNEPGSYTCVNADGQTVRPPAEVNTVADSLAASTNIIDTGKCPAGYQYNIQSQVCDDIDECALGLSSCGPDSDCQNTIGSFICTRRPMENCLPGYHMDNRTRSCIDVDECGTGTHNCSAGEVCSNVDGGFVCNPVCGPGLRVGSSGCVDVDECAENLHRCNITRQNCINTIGSYMCQSLPDCPAGYRKTASDCEDIDECLENIHLCNLSNEICVNEPGGYRCMPRTLVVVTTPRPRQVPACETGYMYNSEYSRCVDIDECLDRNAPPCNSNEDCENTVGSFLCHCKTGFQLDPLLQTCVDINECQTYQHTCLSSQRCDNTIGSFQCIRFTSCGTGYTLNIGTGQCEDDDECLLRMDNCRLLGPAWTCRNTPGSFRCERKHCGAKQVLLPSGECKDLECTTGYTAGQFGKCIDIDECATNSACHQNQQCINTPGSFRCINFFNCGPGYTLTEKGNKCVDVDECAEGKHECGELQTCQNQPGGYMCQCPPGYSMHGKQCLDVDECAKYRSQICGISSHCRNTPGSYDCVCKTGFRQEPGTKQCIDIDECTERPGVCHHKCLNIWGSYRCACNPGFILQNDNRTCLDIDECEKFKDRNLCIGMCINIPGSYKCACPEGYRLGYDGRTCQDIDECATGSVCNLPGEVCANTRGGYRCNTITCPPDYEKDPEHKNRCKSKTLCSASDRACLLKPSSFSYSFISFVSNVSIPPSGQLDLFTMRGPQRTSTLAQFQLELESARAPAGVPVATREHFWLRHTSHNQATISLTRPIQGPQELELQLSMEMMIGGQLGGKAVAKLIVYVSEYEY